MIGFQLIYQIGNNMFTTLGKTLAIEKSSMGFLKARFRADLVSSIHKRSLKCYCLYSLVYNFADDTEILYTEKDPKRLKKRVNIDLKHLLHWLKANKLHLNIAKTDVLLFKNKRKKVNYDIKIKLDGKRMRFSRKVKYLGMITVSYTHLTLPTIYSV